MSRSFGWIGALIGGTAAVVLNVTMAITLHYGVVAASVQGVVVGWLFTYLGVSIDKRWRRTPGSAAADDREWVAGYQSDNGSMKTEHVEGVAWNDAPLPPRRHSCRAQTRAWTDYFTYIERCACGAARLDQRGTWMEKNQTRDHRERTSA